LSSKTLFGIVTATVTPLNEDGQLNLSALSRLNHFLIEKGIHGLFPCGSTGEGVLLSTEERKKVAEGTVKDAAGRVPVVIHTGSIQLKEAIELTSHARDIGADGAALVPPYYFTVDDQTIFQFYSTIASKLPDFPLYVYNIPPNVKNSVSPKVLAQLQSKYPNFVGVKDSSGDFMNFINFKMAMPEDFCVLMGNDAQIYASLLMGAKGAVAATSVAFPEAVVEIYENLKAGNRDKALKAQDRVARLRAVLRSYPPIAAYKTALDFRGIPAGPPRLPLRPMTIQETERLKAELGELRLL
jgi:4-hydroxy-tetrahydrodipicolinate synthase